MQYVSWILTLSLLSTAHAQTTNSDIAPRSQVEASAVSFSRSIELYSETSFRPDYDSLTTDTRMRLLLPTYQKNLKVYAGASIERNLESNAQVNFVENAVSPQVGLLYQPFSWLNIWGEYRNRYQESKKETKPDGEADPRIGISSGFFTIQNSVYFEGYGEAVWVPRLSSGGVLSGYVRSFLRKEVNSVLNADLYTELYGYSSPAKDMGPSRTQARAGGRLLIHQGTWQSSLLVYKPWNFTSDLGNETQLEALLVIGGLF